MMMLVVDDKNFSVCQYREFSMERNFNFVILIAIKTR
jgi:hypothetical protein